MGDRRACRDLMIWVGGAGHQVRTVDEFVKEAQVRGCCRKLPSLPGWARVGKTRVFLAYRDEYDNPARGSIFGYFVLHRFEVVTDGKVAVGLPRKLEDDSLWPVRPYPYVGLVRKWRRKKRSEEEVRELLMERLRRDHIPRIARGETRKRPRRRVEDDDIMDLLSEILEELIQEWVEKQLEKKIGGGQAKRFPAEWLTRIESHRMCSLRRGVGSVYAVDALCAAVHDEYRRRIYPLPRRSRDRDRLLNEIEQENLRVWYKWRRYRKQNNYRWEASALLDSYSGPFLVAVQQFFGRWRPRYAVDPRLKGKAKHNGELVVFNRPFPILEKAPQAAFKGIWRIDGDRLIDQIAQHTGRRALIPKIYSCDVKRPVEFFSLDSSYSRYLKAGRVAAGLRKAFEREGVVLSAGAEVSKMNDKRWEIVDGISSYELDYDGSRVNVSKAAQISTQDELASWLAQELNINKTCARDFLKLMSLKAREQLVLYGRFRLPGIGTIRVTDKETPRAFRLDPYKAIVED